MPDAVLLALIGLATLIVQGVTLVVLARIHRTLTPRQLAAEVALKKAGN